ncbi:hypothetical protein V4C53_21175 [Paraburkholderia azotifigens]|uniref:hypothetical protein n=1 Tax=Paraburkholderia azotifigens TaxID=2057004 RepID=UPI00316D60D5
MFARRHSEERSMLSGLKRRECTAGQAAKRHFLTASFTQACMPPASVTIYADAAQSNNDERAEKDLAYVEEYFVSRASAVERVILARRTLMREMELASAGAYALSQGPSLLDKLEQLLFDVRAGRISDFVMPSLKSKVRILVMSD